MHKNILIVDRNAVFRQGLSELIIKARPDISVYKAASMGQALGITNRVEDISLVLLDILLLDILLLGGDGRLLISKLRDACSNVKIIVISEIDDYLVIQSALDSGANGFVTKSSESLVFLEDIFIYLNDDDLDFISSSSDVVGDCIESTDKKENEYSKCECSLTKRQYEIAYLLMEGLSNKEISERVFLSVGTVKNYISQIYGEISVSSRTQAVIKLPNYLSH